MDLSRCQPIWRDGLEAVWYGAWEAPAYAPVEAPVSASPSAARAPALTTSGGEIYVVWEDLRHGDGEAYLARLDPAGSILSGDLRLTFGEGVGAPSAAWHGNGVVTAYPGTLGGATSEARLVLVGCCLADQDADGLRVCDGDCGTLDGAQAPGTYDSGGTGQQADRDSGLAGICP